MHQMAGPVTPDRRKVPAVPNKPEAGARRSAAESLVLGRIEVMAAALRLVFVLCQADDGPSGATR